MKEIYKQALRKSYKEGRLIPFIGTGLSTPFKVPGWGELIENISLKYVDNVLQAAVKMFLSRKDYWKAIEMVGEFGNLNEFKIQEIISEIIIEKMQQEIADELHNYSDLSNMNFKFYLTTNYDLLINKYVNNPLSVPQVLYKAEINAQRIFENRNYPQIWHMHGHIGDTGSIIISKSKYNDLYNNHKYKDFFKLFQGVGTLLFMGFSFDDAYIQELFAANNSSYNSEHYILLDNPNDLTKHKFAKEYGINVIEYDSNNGGHAKAIREVLDCIKGDDEEWSSDESNETNNRDLLPNETSESGLLKVPTANDRQALESSIFCKKIKLENIDDITLDFSKDCFFMSDRVIRYFRKKGITENVIQGLMALCYMEYMKVKNSSYKNTKNSQLFVDTVHEVLAGLDVENIEGVEGYKSKMFDFQKQGMIHLIADDSKANVWWGENRI